MILDMKREGVPVGFIEVEGLRVNRGSTRVLVGRRRRMDGVVDIY